MQILFHERLSQSNAVHQTSDQLRSEILDHQFSQLGTTPALSSGLRSHAVGLVADGACSSAATSLSPAQSSKQAFSSLIHNDLRASIP